jgi:hypothetical protein
VCRWENTEEEDEAMSRSCIFSSCRKYRYTLWRDVRELGTEHPDGYAMFIALNPSTADETRDDPTIRRCKSFTAREGYGWYLMTNLFGWRETDPDVMKQHPAPIGADNDAHILELAAGAGVVIAAWGVHGAHLDRGKQLAGILSARGIPLMCLRYTKDGSPEHPLYIPGNEPLKPWPKP